MLTRDAAARLVDRCSYGAGGQIWRHIRLHLGSFPVRGSACWRRDAQSIGRVPGSVRSREGQLVHLLVGVCFTCSGALAQLLTPLCGPSEKISIPGLLISAAMRA